MEGAQNAKCSRTVQWISFPSRKRAFSVKPAAAFALALLLNQQLPRCSSGTNSPHRQCSQLPNSRLVGILLVYSLFWANINPLRSYTCCSTRESTDLEHNKLTNNTFCPFLEVKNIRGFSFLICWIIWAVV